MDNFSKQFINKSPFKQEYPKNENDLEYTTKGDSKMSDAEYAKYFSEGSIHRPNLDEVVVTAPRNKRKSLEHGAEEWLEFPQEKARRRTDEELEIKPDKDGLRPEQNSFPMGDARRHYNAGDETARAFADKVKDFPLSFLTRKALGILASNAGGWVHEAQNIKDGNPFMESIEDATNNLAGSLASLFSRKTSKKLFDKGYSKIAPDGKVKN